MASEERRDRRGATGRDGLRHRLPHFGIRRVAAARPERGRRPSGPESAARRPAARRGLTRSGTGLRTNECACWIVLRRSSFFVLRSFFVVRSNSDRAFPRPVKKRQFRAIPNSCVPPTESGIPASNSLIARNELFADRTDPHASIRGVFQGPQALAADVPPEPGVHARRRGRADARYRRQHRHLLRRQRRAAEAVVVPRSRSDRCLHEHVAARIGTGRVAGEVHALPAAVERGPGRLGVHQRDRQLHREAAFRSSCGRAASRRTSSGCSARRSFEAARLPRTKTVHRGHVSRSSATVCGRRASTAIPPSSAQTISLGGEPYDIIGVVGDIQLRAVRHAAAGLDSVPVRSEHGRPGALLPVGGPVEAGSHAGSGEGAARSLGRRVQSQVPQRAESGQQLQRRTRSRPARAERPPVAPRAGRRRQLRPPDRVRQRREPSPRPRDGPAARDRDSRGGRRIARADHPSTAHGKRRALDRRRRAGPAPGDPRHPGAARDQHRRPAARRSGRRARRGRLARRRVHDRDRARHGHPLRADPGAAELEDRPDDHAEGEQRTIGLWLPSEQGAFGAGRHGSRAGADSADRFGAADSHGRRARPGRSRLRRDAAC